MSPFGESRMNSDDTVPRRTFLHALGTSGAAFALGEVPESVPQRLPSWDLGWVERVRRATDRAVFDWPGAEDPADPITMQLAARYLDGCAAVYALRSYRVQVVLNIRTRGVAAALNDRAWEQFGLEAEYQIKDPSTGVVAVRNPYWRTAGANGNEITNTTLVPATLDELVGRGAVILVCDFALGHLAERLSRAAGVAKAAVHDQLLEAFVPGAYAVPSGIFWLVRAQNAGCGLVRV